MTMTMQHALLVGRNRFSENYTGLALVHIGGRMNNYRNSTEQSETYEDDSPTWGKFVGII